LFLPFSPGVYIAMILDHQENIKDWIEGKQKQPTVDIDEYFMSLRSKKEEAKFDIDSL